MLVKPATVNFLRVFAVCGKTRNFLLLLEDRILNSLRLELLADKAQFNFFSLIVCSCGARTSCATSCTCIIFGLYCIDKYEEPPLPWRKTACHRFSCKLPTIYRIHWQLETYKATIQTSIIQNNYRTYHNYCFTDDWYNLMCTGINYCC